MDRENHIGLILLFCLIFGVVLGLFVYTHFILGNHTHVADDSAWVVETPATCTEEGYKYQVCNTCGISFNGVVVAALGHDFADPVEENTVNATCTTGGSYDMASYCSRCNELGTKNHYTTPSLGHTQGEAKVENKILSSCTEFGTYESVVYCTVCDAELSRNPKVIPMLEHTYEERIINYVGVTCTENGSYDVIDHCTSCDDSKYDVHKSHVVIYAEGHKHELVKFEINTSTGKPELYTKCSKCNETHVITTFTDGELTVVDPDKDSDSKTYSATCQKTGVGKYVVNVILDGCKISASCYYVLEIVPHGITAYDSHGKPYNIIVTPQSYDDLGNEIYGYRYDKDLRKLYFDISTPGITVVVDETSGETYDSVWDDYGFAYAAYKCDQGCGKWHIVDVYNAEYDSRKN